MTRHASSPRPAEHQEEWLFVVVLDFGRFFWDLGDIYIYIYFFFLAILLLPMLQHFKLYPGQELRTEDIARTEPCLLF